jgi:hypothetical protein
MNTKTQTLIKPIVVPVIVKAIVAPRVQPAKAETPAVKPVDLVSAKVSVYLSIVPSPAKLGLGQAFLKDTRETGGRAIGLTLFPERLLVSRALAKADQLMIRFCASLLLAEFLVYSPIARLREIAMIGEALRQKLGAPFPFVDNLTFLACELARHEMTSLDTMRLFDTKPAQDQSWLVLEACLPKTPTVWQWNPKLEKPTKKPNGNHDTQKPKP